jgi:geranylgeranyl reductase family protein
MVDDVMFDVVIVGGGPIGCFTGELLSKKGFDVAIIEEHAEIGNPTHCTGILGVDGLNELKIRPGKWVLNKLRSASIYTPSGEKIVLTRKTVEALTIDRATFDKERAAAAANAGATFMLKTRCIGLSLGKRTFVNVKRIHGREELETRLIIGADGPTSLVAREAGLLKTAKYTRCIQVEAEAEIANDNVEMYFGNKIAPGFFAWIVPAGEMCRIGLGTIKGAPKLFEFIKKHPVASKKIKMSRLTHLAAGLIPQPLTRKIYSDRILLVGDAGGQVKPLTGGGIYLGLSCAKLAAETASRALENEITERILKGYEHAVMQKFGQEFNLGLQARKLLQKLSDEELDALLKLLTTPELRSLILREANFNHHAPLLKSLIRRSPSLVRMIGIRKFGKYLRYLIGPQ